MKTTGLLTRAKGIVIAVTTIMLVLSVSSCAVKSDFLVSSVAPAARGTVTIKKDKYNNYMVTIQVANLAEAGRLTPPKNTYVVWMVTDENLTKNIGQIKTSTSLFNKNLKAGFETKSSFKPVRIFITAEYNPAVLNPDSNEILTTGIFDLPK